MKKLVFPILLFLCITAYPQNKCFEGYHVQDLSMNISHIEKALQERFQQFCEFVKDCKAPDFKAATIEGDTIELSKLKEKVVVINFWFIECAPCIAEMPALNKLVEEYKSKDIVFIGMSRSGKNDIIKNFLPKYIFKFKIIPDCGSIEQVGSIADNYKMYHGWPLTYVIDKKGKVKMITNSSKEIYEKLKIIIDKLL